MIDRSIDRSDSGEKATRFGATFHTIPCFGRCGCTLKFLRESRHLPLCCTQSGSKLHHDWSANPRLDKFCSERQLAVTGRTLVMTQLVGPDVDTSCCCPGSPFYLWLWCTTAYVTQTKTAAVATMGTYHKVALIPFLYNLLYRVPCHFRNFLRQLRGISARLPTGRPPVSGRSSFHVRGDTFDLL